MVGTGGLQPPTLSSPVSAVSMPQPYVSSTLSSNNDDFPDGRYIILLLERRDIARKIITLQNHIFTILLCN